MYIWKMRRARDSDGKVIPENHYMVGSELERPGWFLALSTLSAESLVTGLDCLAAPCVALCGLSFGSRKSRRSVRMDHHQNLTDLELT